MTPKELVDAILENPVILNQDNLDRLSELNGFNSTSPWNRNTKNQKLTPGVRDGHSLCTLPKFNAFLIFGGYAYMHEELLSDLWLFDTTTNLWHNLKVSKIYQPTQSDFDFNYSGNYIPTSRDFSDIQVIGDDLVMYGGRTYHYLATARAWKDDYDKAIWVLPGIFAYDSVEKMVKNAPKHKWEQISPAKSLKVNVDYPFPRRSQMSFVRENSFYVLGGVDENKTHHPELWKFNLTSKTWKIVKNLSNRNLPDPRRRGSILYIPGLDWLYMICGTRPATASEKEIMKSIKSKEDKEDDGECLMEVDDLNVFMFGNSLKNKSFCQVYDGLDLKYFDCHDKIVDLDKNSEEVYSRRVKSREMIESLRKNNLRIGVLGGKPVEF